ncbi:MAG: hypothetical protein K0S44_2585 [Bacteroidetes bacterium]|jgi:hypothetical protein|nr:hypothetical protein [Bacteroidota bacterium]
MKPFFTCLILIFYYCSSFSQINFQWANTPNTIPPLGGTIIGNSIKTDSQGNVYITGYFQNTADFDPNSGVANLTSSGGSDVFFAKYDSQGNYLFAKSLGSLGTDHAMDLSLDNNKNIYITGYYNGTVDFNPGDSIVNLTANNTDIFVAKYDSVGNYILSFGLGGSGMDKGLSLTADSIGNIYVTGYFSSSVDFDTGAGIFNLVSSGGFDIFLAKYGTSGNLIFAKRFGSSGYEEGESITLDCRGNIIITGEFSNTVDFDAGPATSSLVSHGLADIFFAKYNNNGNFIFAKGIGGTDDDFGFEIITDTLANIFLTGYFKSSVDFDPGISTTLFNSIGNEDVYFAKYDSLGNYIFAKGFGGISQDIGRSICLDIYGNIYLTGNFASTVDFDTGTGTQNLVSNGASDIFISKYSPTGSLLFCGGIGSTLNDYGRGIVIDSDNDLFTIGHYTGTVVDFDPGASIANLISGSSANIFLGKYNNSGNYLWAKNLGGYGSLAYASQGLSIDSDDKGNTYTTGCFQGTVNFSQGSNPVTLTSNGNFDIFFLKYDISGNLIFAKQIGSTGDDRGSSITTDNNKNIYLTGSFTGTVDFDPGISVFNMTASGNNDVFFAKFDSLGNFMLAGKVGGTGFDLGRSIIVDNIGNIYISGYFSGNSDFDPGTSTYNLNSSGGTDAFFAKYNSIGNLVYANKLGAASSDESTALAIDNQQNIYVTGFFSGTVDFDPSGGIMNISAAGNQVIFLAKYDSLGNYLYAKSMGGAAGYDYGLTIGIDNYNNTYLSGFFNGTVDFDGNSTNYNLISSGNYDIFLAKYDSIGNFVFAKKMGSTGIDYGNSLSIDNANNIFLTGYFQDTVDFNPASATNDLISKGGYDIFIAKYDLNGNYINAKNIGGPNNDLAFGITTYNESEYITGTFSGNADFDPSLDLANAQCLNTSDIFIAKYSESCTNVTVNTNGNNLTAIPGMYSYQWIDCNNGLEIFGETNQTYTPLSNGNFAVIVTTLTGCTDTSYCVSLITTTVGEINSLALVNIFPNPFNTETFITYSLDQKSKVSIEIFSIEGQKIESIVNCDQQPGEFKYTFSAKEKSLKSGIYFAKIIIDNKSIMRKIIEIN